MVDRRDDRLAASGRRCIGLRSLHVWHFRLAVAWSFVLSGYSTFTGVPIWGVFKLLGWIATVIILALTSLAFIGPVFLLLLMLPGIVSSG